MTAEFITPKAFANEIAADPKQVRKFLRSLTPDRAGKGGRWEIPASMIPELKIRFAEFEKRNTRIFTPAIDDANDDA